MKEFKVIKYYRVIYTMFHNIIYLRKNDKLISNFKISY